MSNSGIPLSCLKPGAMGKILSLDLSGTIRRRILDLGMVTDTLIESIGKSPSGDPTAYYIRGTVVAIRDEDASKIMVEPVDKNAG